MRIIYFSRDYTTHDRRFLLKLSASAHAIYYLRLEDDGMRYEQRGLPGNVEIVNWEGGRHRATTIESWLRLMPALEAVIGDVQPDLIHAGPVQPCGFMTALTNFHPFLVMSWGSDILVDADKGAMWRWMTRFTLAQSDMLICDCETVRERALSLCPSYSSERIVQFPWGIDLAKFFPGSSTLHLRSQLGWNDSLIVLSTRTWEPRYGLDTLMEAFSLALSAEPRLRLLLVGTGSMAPQVTRWIEEGDLHGFIHCPGLISHEALPDYFRLADMYLSCSFSDGSSISLLEALATGLPVIAADNPSNREWVTPGENGWLADSASPEAYANSLLKAVCLSAEERTAMTCRNRLVAETRANWDLNFNKLLQAYDASESLKGEGFPLSPRSPLTNG